jgi:putative glutamine amidotransferase
MDNTMKKNTICSIIIILFGLFSFGRLFSQPLIGITSIYEKGAERELPKVSTNYNYVEAVIKAGGTPVVLPTIEDPGSIEKYIRTMDGLLLVGGDDIPPSAYGEKPHPTVRTLSDKRYHFESKLIKLWLSKTKKPMLGICLGMQFTNVVSGGTLIQDIPSEKGHKVIHRTWQGAEHAVKVEKATRLYRILGSEELTVFSWHHQAVDKMGKGLRIAAKSRDNVIEAMELRGKRFGVFTQWHPERRQADAYGEKIFKAFIKACSKQ